MEHKGFLISSISSYYEIRKEDGQRMICRARGKLKLDGIEPLPGDRVRWMPNPTNSCEGILTGIEHRKNCFVRPNVANVDQIVFVATAARPITDPSLIDRLSVAAEYSDAEFILCLNKMDLDEAEKLREQYAMCRFPVLPVSAHTGEGMELLRQHLEGKVSVLTGNSGVGKSSILNFLLPDAALPVNEISQKHGRGKHTTRHTTFYPLSRDGWVADSPGFASLELSQLCDVQAQQLADCFAEFPRDRCRFHDCMHHNEPDCAVRGALAQGQISDSRYTSYITMLKELQEREKNKFT